MKTSFIVLFFCVASSIAHAQVYMTQAGETSFFSDTPLENIAAKNNQTAAAINTANGEIAAKMQMSQFVFPNKLMQEHFNENYMESAKYPSAIFKGKIQETIDYKKEGVYDVSAKGTLEIHGVKQERTLKGKLTISKDNLTLESDFDVKLVDHKIEIPKVVFAKIAEVIAVKNKWLLIPKK